MSKPALRVGFLTSGALWPVWLSQSARQLIGSGKTEALSHCFLDGGTIFEQSRLRRSCFAPFRYLESRAYNPSDIDALEDASGDDIEHFDGTDNSGLQNWIEVFRPNVVICEGDCSTNLLNTLRGMTGLRLLAFNESWSSGIPSNATRCQLSGNGWVDLTLSDVTHFGKIEVLTSTRSQLSSLSLSSTIHQHLLKGACLPLRALEAKRGSEAAELSTVIGRLSVLEGLSAALLQAWRRVKQRLLRHNDHAWSLAIGERRDSDRMLPDLSAMCEISPPSGRLWADPFLAKSGDRNFLFFEELVFGENFGKLLVGEVDATGLISKPEIVLEQPWHLSYPQVFKHNGRWYMIPESGDAKRLDLYVADDFPRGWRHVKTLIDGKRIFDATLLYRDGLWWLFATVAEQGISEHDELYLFYTSDFIDGTWIPHALNPVISDATQARPAGRFMQKNGRLFRPSQDSRERYGCGLALNEVCEISPTSYREKTIERMLPQRQGLGYRGIHTINEAAEMVAVDFIR